MYIYICILYTYRILSKYRINIPGISPGTAPGASRVCTAHPRKMWNGAAVSTRKMAPLGPHHVIVGFKGNSTWRVSG